MVEDMLKNAQKTVAVLIHITLFLPSEFLLNLKAQREKIYSSFV